MPKAARYEVIWAQTALRDLQNVIEFIANRNPSVARTVLHKIRRKAVTLTRFPMRGRVVPELKEIGLSLYRESVIFPYRLMFRVKGRQVLVLGVFDGRRDLEDVLFERLTRL